MPRDDELSKPVKAPTARTVPSAMPVALDPLALNWLVSRCGPKWTKRATMRMAMATSEMSSRVTATWVEMRMPRTGRATANTKKMTSSGSCHGRLSALTPSLARKAPK